MAKNFKQLDTWIGKTDHPAGKAYMNEQGHPLTGFVMRETKNTKTITICGNGHYQMAYTIDKKLEIPPHQLIRWMNITMCGGFLLFDEQGKRLGDNDAIADAVFDGLKPVGDLFYLSEEEAKRVADSGRSLGFEVLEYQREFPTNPVAYRVMIGVNRPIREIFDLEAIARYYEKAVPYMTPNLRNRFRKIGSQTPIDTLGQFDWANPTTECHLITTGLLLGYPLESTVSLLKRNW